MSFVDFSSYFEKQKEYSLEEVLNQNEMFDDFFLGNIKENQKNLNEQNFSAYAQIEVDALMTPYYDFWRILNYFPKKYCFVDLGFAYPRSFIVANIEGRKAKGVELVKERVDYACEKLKEKGFNNLQELICANILDDDFELPDGDIYFLYLPNGPLLFKILLLLSKKKVSSIKVVAVESHGDNIPYLNSLSAFTEEKRILSSISRLDPYIYFFNFDFQKIDRLHETIWEASLCNDYVVIVKEKGKELAYPLKDCELTFYDHETYLLLKTPSKDIPFKNIVEVKSIDSQSQLKSFVLSMQGEGLVKGYKVVRIFFKDKLVELINGNCISW